MKKIMNERFLHYYVVSSFLLIIVLVFGLIYTNTKISHVQNTVDKTYSELSNDNSANGITDVGNNLQSLSNKADEINNKLQDLQQTIRDLCLGNNFTC
jgi:peptidoglycan hydrolase CwlO-like protein